FALFGLLVEVGDVVTREGQVAEARRWPDRGHGRLAAMRAVERGQLPDVDVGDTVAGGEEEVVVVVLEPVLQPAQATACHAGSSRVDEVHLPVGLLAVMDGGGARLEVD